MKNEKCPAQNAECDPDQFSNKNFLGEIFHLVEIGT
jgi:hypothetical protein